MWNLLFSASFAGRCTRPSSPRPPRVDRRTGALQIYFARPVSRLDYSSARCSPARSSVSLTTAVPCLLVWLESVAFSPASKLHVAHLGRAVFRRGRERVPRSLDGVARSWPSRRSCGGRRSPRSPVIFVDLALEVVGEILVLAMALTRSS